LPQQNTSPLFTSAHVAPPPATTCVASATPVTGAGCERGVVVLSPSWLALLSPQHWTVPSFFSAQECA
jgi:hypothetical protein